MEIRIRIGSSSAGDYETKEYTNSTFAEAVAALQGKHVVGDDISQAAGNSGFHHRVNVYVVATHAEDHDEKRPNSRRFPIQRKAGEPIFGEEATVYGRDVRFGGVYNAEVSWASGGSMSTDDAEIMVSIYQLALQLAIAANAEPFCAGCKPELDRYAERDARMASSETGV